MKKIQLGIVGYGFRGPGLLQLARGLAECEPAAICDSDPQMLNKGESEFPDISLFDNYTTMLDSGKVDAVLVETPPMTHAEYAIGALERNIHVLSDVPAIHSLDEAGPLWDAAQRSQAIYMFGSNANYWGFVSHLSDLKKKGLVGVPFYMEAEYVHDITEFAKSTPWRQGYEPIRYCTHSLGPALQWLEDELVTVSCLDSGSHVYPEKEGHDAMVAIFKSRSNAVVKLMTCFTNSLPFGVHRYLCHGTQGYFDCTWPLTGGDPEVRFCSKKDERYEELTSIEVATAPARDSSSLEDISGFGAVDFAMLEDFVGAIKGAPYILDLKQGFRMTLPGLYAIESARKGGQLTTITYPWE